MCGRFALAGNLHWLIQKFMLPALPVFSPRYNICPSQPVLSVIYDQDRKCYRWEFLNWGLIPSWAKEPGIGQKMINARSETIAEKPSFKDAFRYRRCIIPATGFYEWKKSRGESQPFYFFPKDPTAIFLFAGLWEIWHGPNGEEVRTCSIITTNANLCLSDIHHRMPVILEPENIVNWVSLTTFKKALHRMLKPFSEEKMDRIRVNKFVNNTQNDSPECVSPFKELQPTLF
jgi:putative SOS response-associated peptidase YedK